MGLAYSDKGHQKVELTKELHLDNTFGRNTCRMEVMK